MLNRLRDRRRDDPADRTPADQTSTDQTSIGQTSTDWAPADRAPTARTSTARRRRYALAAGGLVVLLPLGLVTDRIVASRVESSTAEAFRDSQNLPATPSVTVHGVPVLTQLAAGSLDRVDIQATDIPAGQDGRRTPITRLDLELDDLSRSSDADEARAGQARAKAFVSYADLSKELDVDLSPAGGGRVNARTDVPLLGRLTASARLEIAGADRLAFESVRLDSRLPDRLAGLLTGVLERPLRLSGVPQGLALKSITAGRDGITARLSGEDVTFRTTAT